MVWRLIEPSTMRVALPFVCSLFALIGCGPSLDELLAKERQVAEAKLRLVSRVAPIVKNEPEGLATVTSPGPMSICDLMVPAYREAPCDTFVISLEQLESPERYLNPKPVIDYGPAEWLVLTSNLLKHGRYPPTEEYPSGAEPDRVTLLMETAFRWLRNLRYLIVTRPITFAPPKVAEDQRSYSGGLLEAEAILIALEPAPRSLGAVQYRFEMSGDIKIRMKGGVINEREIQDAFSKVVRGELQKALEQRLPELEPAPTR
jgi:hypothetical protein